MNNNCECKTAVESEISRSVSKCSETMLAALNGLVAGMMELRGGIKSRFVDMSIEHLIMLLNKMKIENSRTEIDLQEDLAKPSMEKPKAPLKHDSDKWTEK